MNKLTISNNDGQFVTDSREVALMTGIRHDNLLAKIDGYVSVLRANLNFKVSDFFIEMSYTDSTGRNLKRYDITKKGCDMVANKMTGEKGILFTATYVTHFEEMEKQIAQLGMPIPSYMLDDPRKRALRWIEELEEKKMLESEKLALEQRVKEIEPKASYVDAILKSKGTVTTTQIAKDYGLTATELNDILREQKIQYKVNNQWVLYRNHANKGYTQSHAFDFVHKDGTPDVKMNTRWTQRGRLFIHEVLTDLGYKANIDKEFDDAR